MTSEEQKKISYDMLYLTACALHGTVPDDEKTAGMHLQSLYRFGCRHALGSVLCMALEGTSVYEHADSELKKKFQDVKNKAIRKNMLLDAERLQLFKAGYGRI